MNFINQGEVKMPKSNLQHQRRNPIAQAAIMRKGGVHEESRKTKRQKQKRELRKMISKAMAAYSGHFFVCFFQLAKK